MKFSVTAILLALATAVMAVPHPTSEYPAPSKMTVNEAEAKCGNAQLSCCNKKIQNFGDNTQVNSGILNGVLGSLLNGGPVSNIGIFDQCSKLSAAAGILGAGVSDIANSQCKQNIACCQQTSSNANGLVAVALPCIPVAAL